MKPEWLKTPIPTGETYFNIRRDLRAKQLFTVCEEAKCPNISECWGTNTATFMILGDTCTRACRFCHVKTGDPAGWLDPHEAANVATAVLTMKLRYAVITMVDRDDLADGGAAHAAGVFRSVKEASPATTIEFLGGDFRGLSDPLQTVLDSGIEVFAHNIETVERLTPRVRDARAAYRLSLQQLAKAKDLSAGRQLFTKSALMLGLGETIPEVRTAMADLRIAGVDFLTIGQYMRPTKKHLSIKEYVHPDVFKELEVEAYALGFRSIAAGPLVRSSYRAREFYEKALSLTNKS